MIKGSSIEADSIKRRLVKDKLYEDPATCTIVAANGRQRYFRTIEGGKDVFVRHGIALGRYHILNHDCTEFVPAPANKVYRPDTSRPFTEKDLLRDATVVESGIKLIKDNVPNSVAGTLGTAAVGTAFVALSPLGAPIVAAGGLVGAKLVAGAKVIGTVVSHHSAAAMIAGAGIAVGIVLEDEEPARPRGATSDSESSGSSEEE